MLARPKVKRTTIYGSRQRHQEADKGGNRGPHPPSRRTRKSGSGRAPPNRSDGRASKGDRWAERARPDALRRLGEERNNLGFLGFFRPPLIRSGPRSM